MLRQSSSAVHSLLHRRGQMSTTAIVFLVLGIVFAIMVVVGAILAALLLPAVQQARTAARSTQSKNNLKQIGLAIHNYHEVYRNFPPGGVFTKQDEPYNAWMTSLLPYLEQSALYQQIDTNQPWTAQRNQMAFQCVVPNYLNPNLDREFSAVGGLGAAHYAGNSQVLRKNGGNAFRDVTDGLSNTILAGEVSGGFMAWGDPENVRDPGIGFGTGPDQFGGPVESRRGTMMLMGDGAVQFISNDIDPETLRNLANPKDGNVVGNF